MREISCTLARRQIPNAMLLPPLTARGASFLTAARDHMIFLTAASRHLLKRWLPRFVEQPSCDLCIGTYVMRGGLKTAGDSNDMTSGCITCEWKSPSQHSGANGLCIPRNRTYGQRVVKRESGACITAESHETYFVSSSHVFTTACPR